MSELHCSNWPLERNIEVSEEENQFLHHLGGYSRKYQKSGDFSVPGDLEKYLTETQSLGVRTVLRACLNCFGLEMWQKIF